MDEKASILIVDDDEGICRTLALMLNRAGYETETVRSGNQALEKAREKFYNAVLLDIQLPDIEGTELLEPLYKMHPDMAVIMITAFASTETVIQSFNKGAWAYIIKPLNLDELLDITLRQVIEKQQLIQDKQQIENVLRESEYKFRSIFEGSKDAIYIATPAGRLTDINPAGLELFGYSLKDEFLNLDIATNVYINPDDRDKFLQTLIEYGHVSDYKLNLKNKDGKKIVALETADVVRDETGDVVAYHGILQDVTKQRQLQEQLLQSQKMEAIGRLAGGIAHDFNNLLTVIAGNLELSLITLDGEDPLRERLEIVNSACKSASALTSQLLTFSRKQGIKPQVLNLNDILTRIDKMLRRVIGEDIHLTTKPCQNTVPVRVDTGQIEQVLMNLAVNAREAMPEGGYLTIEVKSVILDNNYIKTHPTISPGQYAMLAVSDTGHGMDEDTKTQIFEPYFSKKVGGTGLGLSTVYGIVEQYGGSINVYSEETLGTTFKIYLPIVEEAIKPSPIEETAVQLPRGQETILLVEDEEGVRDLAAGILDDLGYTVHSFKDGIEAERFYRQNEGMIDLLITDVVMPRINGAELAANLKAVRPSMPVIFMSGYPGAIIKQHPLMEEGTDFLSKPFSPSIFAKKVRDVLDGPSKL